MLWNPSGWHILNCCSLLLKLYFVKLIYWKQFFTWWGMSMSAIPGSFFAPILNSQFTFNVTCLRSIVYMLIFFPIFEFSIIFLFWIYHDLWLNTDKFATASNVLLARQQIILCLSYSKGYVFFALFLKVFYGVYLQILFVNNNNIIIFMLPLVHLIILFEIWIFLNFHYTSKLHSSIISLLYFL